MYALWRAADGGWATIGSPVTLMELFDACDFPFSF
jgi:hypothetical protein